MAARKPKGTAVAKRDEKTGTGVAVPDYLKSYTGATGAEGISNDDVTIPRIKLAQALTPEVKEGTVNIGDLFLNVSGEVLAKAGEELAFTPVAVGKEFILWNPERGEGILARARRVNVKGEAKYEWDKQGETFEVKLSKNGPKVKWKTERYVEDNGMGEFGSAHPDDPDSMPAATAHHNYVVVLPNNGGMVAAFSLSRSQEKRAKDLNALFKLGGAPIFSRVFKVKTVDDRNGDGDEFKNYKFSPDGFVQNADDFETYRAMFDSFADRGFNVDQSDEDNADASTGTSI